MRHDRYILLSLALAASCTLAACKDSGGFGAVDAAPDLSLPTQVTHVGVKRPVCCIETTRAAWRVLYLANPVPGGSDSRGRDEATKGELHLADAYGADFVLAAEVPRGGYLFTGDGRYVLFLSPGSASDKSYALKIAALPTGTLGTLDPVTVIERGLEARPLDQQAFFSPTGRFLIVGVAPKGITNSTDLTAIEVESARVVLTLPGGSFNYIEAVTTNDVMIYQNSTASKQLGTPSVVGLYALPLGAAASGGLPARIDTRTVTYTLSTDERRVLYTRQDGALWLYDLADKSRVKLADGVVSFAMGPAANGPVIWVGQDLALHVVPIYQPELLATAPGATDPWTAFTFSPSAQDLYFFDRSSAQDSVGDLYRIDLRPGQVFTQPQLLDHRVSQYDLTFAEGRLRYLRGVDGRGDAGELVSAKLDGSDARSIARGVAVGSMRQANPRPIPEPSTRGNPERGPLDFAEAIIPSVWSHLVDARRDTSRGDPLFDDSEPVVGGLAFARGDELPTVVAPTVHVGGFRFSPDGYMLVYSGGAMLDDNLAAYVGSLRIFQTLVDQAPVPPMLSGVSEIGRIRERALFVAAPAASPPGVYFVRY